MHDTRNSSDKAASRSHMTSGMRALLALLALIGLLLSPVAASAAAPVCLHHHDGASMAMDMNMPMTGMAMPMAAPHVKGAAKAGPCCDDDAGKPVQHDGKSCAQACAAICGVGVALTETAVGLSLTVAHARVEPAAPSPLHAHGPPGLKRPPKQDA